MNNRKYNKQRWKKPLITLMTLVLAVLSVSPVYAVDSIDNNERSQDETLQDFKTTALELFHEELSVDDYITTGGPMSDAYTLRVNNDDTFYRNFTDAPTAREAMRRKQMTHVSLKPAAGTSTNRYQKNHLQAPMNKGSFQNLMTAELVEKTGHRVTFGKDSADVTADGGTLAWRAASVNGASQLIDVTAEDKEPIAVDETAEQIVTNKNTMSYDVTTIWEDRLKKEPVFVQLLQDGKEYGEPVELTDTKGWTYRWIDLPVDHNYSVQEITKNDEWKPEMKNGATLAYENVFTGDSILTDTEVVIVVGENQALFGPAEGGEVRLETITCNADGSVSLPTENANSFLWKVVQDDAGFYELKNKATGYKTAYRVTLTPGMQLELTTVNYDDKFDYVSFSTGGTLIVGRAALAVVDDAIVMHFDKQKTPVSFYTAIGHTEIVNKKVRSVILPHTGRAENYMQGILFASLSVLLGLCLYLYRYCRFQKA